MRAQQEAVQVEFFTPVMAVGGTSESVISGWGVRAVLGAGLPVNRG